MEPEEDRADQDDVQQRHRLERKELQAKITALKKTYTKNDKKKKKEVSDVISKLEEELNERQKQELNALHGEDPMEAMDQEVIITEEPVEETEVESVSEVKMTRAQRRRNKKETDDRERNKRITEQEKVNRQGPRSAELNTINEALQKEGLQIFTVPADGNCLYCSIKHQLETTGRDVLEVDKLRKLTADFMRDNKDEFLPFMCNDSEEPVNDVQFEKYCKDVASTKLWGGQLELRALSNILQCPIKIIQASGPTTVQGEQFHGRPLTLTYHRHLYRLGEHYNSTSTVAVSEVVDS